jgi:alpha-amylase/alpha-mannosidase (GH57 family)
LGEYGFNWCASGEAVLRNSLARAEHKGSHCIHKAYRSGDSDTLCFFRDDGLSDLIGFSYADWHADDAVANLLHHLENIAAACKGEEAPIVSIIMDGENAWEYYPNNAYYFLSALYEGLAKHKGINLTTYSDYLAASPPDAALPQLVAGSWVYGTFSTWIGMKDKNRAWDMLAEAKRSADTRLAGELEPQLREQIEQQLAICEGSDWFWWMGDYNPVDSVRDFDLLFRRHLANLYLLLGEEPPASLSSVISHGSGAPAMGGVMRRGSE